MTDPRRVLVVAPRPPLPVRYGANLRVLQHLAVLRRAGWDVHLFVLDPGSWVPGVGNEALATCHVASDTAVTVVQGTGDPTRLGWITAGENPFAGTATDRTRAELTAVVAEVQPDLVVVSGHEVSALLSEARRDGAPLVLDLHNVLANVIAGLGDLDTGHRARALLHRRAAAAARPIEAALLRLADQVWACSEHDAQLLHAHGTNVPVITVPNTVDLRHYPDPDPDLEPRIVFTASFSYSPNQRAALELIDALDHLPGVALDLVGAAVPAVLHARAADHPRVTVTGRVPDVRPYLQRAWLTAMPVRAGSGTRLKVGEAAAARVPIVATAKAVEGIPMEAGVHYLCAESPAEFVAAIRRLLDDEGLRRSLVDAAHELAATHLSWEAATHAALPAIEALLGPDTVDR